MRKRSSETLRDLPKELRLCQSQGSNPFCASSEPLFSIATLGPPGPPPLAHLGHPRGL